MFYYIKQFCAMSYPIRLVETESDLIVRSVETGLGRLALVVAVIVLMLILFQLSQTWLFVLRIQEEVFSNFSAMLLLEVCPYTAIYGDADNFEVPECHMIQQMSSQ